MPAHAVTRRTPGAACCSQTLRRDTRWDHVHRCRPNLAQRQAARAELHLIPAAATLFAEERDATAGEGSEPDGLA